MITLTGSGAAGSSAFHTIAVSGFYLLALVAAVSTPIPAGATVKFEVSSPALPTGLDVQCSAALPHVERTKTGWVYLEAGDVLSFGVSLTGTHPTPPLWSADLRVYTGVDVA